MKIIYVLKSVGISGGIKVVFEHLNGLSARGHDCELCYLSGDASWFGNIDFKLNSFGNENDLIDYLRDRPDAIKVATWWETAYWVAQAGNGYYLVQDIETSYSSDAGYKDKVMATYRLGLHHLAENSFQYTALKYVLNVDVSRIGIAIDHNIFKPQHTERDGTSGLYFYRNNHLKNPKVMADAMSIMPDFKLYAFGPEKCPFATNIDGHKTDSDIARIMASYGVYIATSSHEGFCLPILEAMACGTPVVTTRANGNETFCINNVNCLIVDDHYGIKEAVYKILNDTKLSKRLVKNGLTTASNYRWDNVIDELEAIYDI